MLTEGATKITGVMPISRKTSIPDDVPPQGFPEKHPETRIKPRLAPSIRAKNGVQLSNSGGRVLVPRRSKYLAIARVAWY